MRNLRLTLLTLLLPLTGHSQNLIPDSLFATNGSVIFNFINYDQPHRLLALPDEKFLVGGSADGGGYDVYTALARFDICGNPDPTFSDDGMMFHSFDLRNTPYDIAVQDDGKIICAGQEANSNAGSGQIPFVSRYLNDGTPDSGFNDDGFIPQRFDNISSGSFYSVHIYPDGRILCIGLSAGNINGGVSGFGAMRFSSDGILDPNFDGDGIARYTLSVASYGQVRGHLLPTGKIIEVFCTLSSYPYHFYFSASALDSTGALDTSFGTGGAFIDNIVVKDPSYTDMKSDGKIIIAGVSEDQVSAVVACINSDGELDTSFGDNGHVIFPIIGGYSAEVRGVRVISNDKILVFGTKGGTPFIIALNADGTVKTDFGSNGYLTTAWNDFRYVGDYIELGNGQLMGAAATNSPDFNVLRLIENSNVPHIAYDGATLISSGGDFFQWYVDGGSISGATNNTWPPQVNGYYQVMATDSFGCSYLSDSFLVENAFVESVTAAHSIKLFPNPVIDHLYFEGAGEKIIEVIITDASGKELKRVREENGIEELPFDFSKGVYVVRVKSAVAEGNFLVTKVSD